MIVRGIVDRRTHDLDFFATKSESVAALAVAADHAIRAAGMSCERIRTAEGFVRLQVSGGTETCELDLSYDARVRPAERVGGTEVLSIEELAADKTLAVFGRAVARDFVDPAALVHLFGWERLFALAREKDLGFDRRYFLDALRAFDRLPADTFDIDPADYDRLRAKVQLWRRELSAELQRDRDRGMER